MYIIILNFMMAILFPTSYATMVTDTGWQTINNNKYYLKDSELVHGLQEIDGDTYFFDENGKMLTGVQFTPEERFFGQDGKQQAGVHDSKGHLILYTEDGRASKGWHDNYYVTLQGTLATGLQRIEGKTYFFNDKGEKTTGWQDTPEKRYFDNNGVMVTGNYEIDGLGYYFNEDGTISSGFIANKYYNEDGTVFVGERTIGAMTFVTDNEGYIVSKTTQTGLSVVSTARSTKPGENFIQEVYTKYGAVYDKEGKVKSAGQYTADGMAGDIVVYKDKDNYKIDAGVYIGNNTMIDAETGKDVAVNTDENTFVGYYRHDFLKRDLSQNDKY